MNEPWFYAAWVVAAYVLGSLSVGDLVARAKGVDIRSLGTGNPGAANIYREIGPAYGVGVFILDVAKGSAATFPIFVLSLSSWAGMLAMLAVMGGHFFPIPWRSFGGTGMAVTMGATAGLLPLGAVIATLPALLFVRFTRNPGYTGLLYFVLAIVAGWLVHRDPVAVAGVLLGVGATFAKSLIQYRGM